jgi:hypothetical protein
MASNVISVTIDEEFPVAGVDNDSQGFRDNFRIIKDSLAATKAELEDLQVKTLLKSALTDTELDNNMAGTSLVSVNLDQHTESVTAVGSVGNNQNISFLNGHYQTVSATGDITLTLSDWPTEGYAKVTVALNSDNTSTRTITFVGEGTAAFKKVTTEGWTAHSATQVQAITSSDLNPTIVEFWTVNGGNTIFAKYLGVYQ